MLSNPTLRKGRKLDIQKYEIVVDPGVTYLVKGGIYEIGEAAKVAEELQQEVVTLKFDGKHDSLKVIRIFGQVVFNDYSPSLAEKWFMKHNEKFIKHFKLKNFLQEHGQRIRIKKEHGENPWNNTFLNEFKLTTIKLNTRRQ